MYSRILVPAPFLLLSLTLTACCLNSVELSPEISHDANTPIVVSKLNAQFKFGDCLHGKYKQQILEIEKMMTNEYHRWTKGEITDEQYTQRRRELTTLLEIYEEVIEATSNRSKVATSELDASGLDHDFVDFVQPIVAGEFVLRSFPKLAADGTLDRRELLELAWTYADRSLKRLKTMHA